jgi:SAM-dependent methyltransferase
MSTRPAEERWARALQSWAIPQHILERAPESPWGFPPALFEAHAATDSADTPSRRRALEVLPERGSVIDVGVGGGAASLALVPRVGKITGVDQSEDMLRSFADAATRAGVAHREVKGTWPQIAPEAGVADVVVCHHVFYNAPELGSFASGLTSAADRRVVVELTAVHPASMLNHLWRHFHDLERPEGPTYEDALAVLSELGLEAGLERWSRPPRHAGVPRSEIVAFARRRLCLSADRDPEIDGLLGDAPVLSPSEVVTLWWEA